MRQPSKQDQINALHKLAETQRRYIISEGTDMRLSTVNKEVFCRLLYFGQIDGACELLNECVSEEAYSSIK